MNIVGKDITITRDCVIVVGEDDLMTLPAGTRLIIEGISTGTEGNLTLQVRPLKKEEGK